MGFRARGTQRRKDRGPEGAGGRGGLGVGLLAWVREAWARGVRAQLSPERAGKGGR